MKFRFTVWLLFLFIVQSGYSQTSVQHHYVTIGVFALHENAIRFTDKANALNFSAQYAIHPTRKLYFVYILDSEDKRKAFAFLTKIKVETEFKTAWVYSGVLGEQQNTEPVKEEVKEEPEPIKAEPIKLEEPKKEEPKAEEIKPDAIKPEPVIEQPKIDSSDLVKPESETKPEGKPFFFKLVNGETGSEVVGEVHVLTSPRATQYQSFPVNQIVYIKAPQSGVLQITTVAAGYKEMKRAVNYNDPASSAAELGPKQEAIVALPLVRVKLGDYIEFSNVKFFPNSALLQPESKNELDGLVDLMKENIKYKIKIHGHCNGDNSRDIVSKGTSSNFFGTDAGNLKENGSAKKLTELRAELVKEYLVSQGIDAERITTKGEGGKQYIYPQNSTLSARNDRVEIEVVKGK